MKTRYGSFVMPKIAGIESSAKIRSVVPIAIMTISIGVNSRRPVSVTMVIRPLSNEEEIGSARFDHRIRMFSLKSSSSFSPCLNSVMAV